MSTLLKKPYFRYNEGMDIFFAITGFTVVAICTGYVFFLLGIAWGGLYDAPYVPSNRRTTAKMLEAAKIKSKDVVYELGSGDGRLVFGAAEKAKKAIGYELSWPIYLLSKFKQWRHGKKGELNRGSFYDADLGDADIVFCYLLPKTMKKLQQKFEKELKPGCRVISHAFQIPGWKVTETVPANRADRTGSVHVYIKK